jgi:hypothetical protein
MSLFVTSRVSWRNMSLFVTSHVCWTLRLCPSRFIYPEQYVSFYHNSYLLKRNALLSQPYLLKKYIAVRRNYFLLNSTSLSITSYIYWTLCPCPPQPFSAFCYGYFWWEVEWKINDNIVLLNLNLCARILRCLWLEPGWLLIQTNVQYH